MLNIAGTLDDKQVKPTMNDKNKATRTSSELWQKAHDFDNKKSLYGSNSKLRGIDRAQDYSQK